MSESSKVPVAPPEADPAVLRELWNASAPTAAEVAAASARIGLQVGTGGGLTGVLLKALAVLGTGAGLTLAVLGVSGTLAEPGGQAGPGGEGTLLAAYPEKETASLPQGARPPAVAEQGGEVRPASVPDPSEAGPETPSANRFPARARGSASLPSRGPQPASGGDTSGEETRVAPSWGAIAVALEGGDQTEARRQLELLGGSDDPKTQAKAHLGLAQLELSRGNRARAVELAQAVIADPGAGDSLHRRARSLLVRARAPAQ